MAWLSLRSTGIGSCFVALCGILLLIRMGMKQRSEQTLRRPEPSEKNEKATVPFSPLLPEEFDARLSNEEVAMRRDLQQQVWWPKWSNDFDTGYCCNTEHLPKHGIPHYATKSLCCDSWFPRQSSRMCMDHNGNCSNSPRNAPHTNPPPANPPPGTSGSGSGSVPTTVTPPAPSSTQPETGPSPDPNPSPGEPNELETDPTPDAPIDLPLDWSSCEDLNFTEDEVTVAWTMPTDSIWGESKFAGKSESKFAGMNCTQIEQLIPESELSLEQRQVLCNFLSRGVIDGPTASQACCFCGGGSSTDPKANCRNMEFNALEGNGRFFDCDFIDSLSNRDTQKKLCNDLGSESFAEDGLTMREACCACGGGDHAFNTGSVGGRKLQDDGAENASPTFVTVLPDGKLEVDLDSKVDYTYRIGAGDSPGVSNLEYLGLGYDIFRGNPRGTETSELDPGFRYRVIKLRQDQNNLLVDGEYTVPFGVSLKYTSSCKYDSKSTEISSVSDMRTSLSGEVSMDATSTNSVGFEVGLGLIFSYSQKVSESHSFSQSNSFEKTTELRTATSSVSFEAKAVCSEFEASFIPGGDHVLSDEFKNALGNLFVPYDKDNPRHMLKWRAFFNNFGTEYVRYLVLGGKRIESTSMSEQDYSSLVSDSVSVSSSMSFEMSAAMGASAKVKAGMVKGAASLLSKAGPKGAAIGSVVNFALEGTDDDDTVLGGEISASSSSSLANFASNTKQAESAFAISKKDLTTEEYTIGGLPYDDWREWAESVREKPMPIKYELGSLMEFMSLEQQTAFIAAVQHIYGIDLDVARGEPILKGLAHFGVYSGSGDPVTLHTLDPNDDSRVLMQNDVAASKGTAGGAYEYDFSKSDAGFRGKCLDRSGKDYEYILRGKIVAPFTEPQLDSLESCVAFCEEGPAGPDKNKFQVGLSFEATGYRSTCICHYDDVQISIVGDESGANGYTTGSSNSETGFGPVARGSGSDIFRCYPSQTFRTRSDIFTYSDIWKAKPNKPIAIFATPIRGSIAESVSMESIDDEDRMNPFREPGDGDTEWIDIERWNDGVYFALSKNLNSNGVLAVTNFGGKRTSYTSNQQLPSYSFLSMDTPRLHGADLLSGVVANNGMVLDKDGRSQFMVAKSSTKIKISWNEAYDTTPTVMVFPVWLSPSSEDLPLFHEELKFAIREINSSFLMIGQPSSGSSLGFNFAIIGPGMPTTHIKHGIIHCESGLSTFHGITVDNGSSELPSECNSMSLPSNFPEDHMGVKIMFESPFSDIPAVIATPYDEGGPNFVGAPKCLVESITRSSARVKCALVVEFNGCKGYRPIAFTFVAVGNA